jgi:hypothetical protein
MTKPYDPFDLNDPFAAFPLPSSINISEQFSNGAFLLDISDAQLELDMQSIFNQRIEVTSLYQDDMPGYSASLKEPYKNMEARIDYVRKFLAKAFPTVRLDHDDKCFKGIAESRSARIDTIITHGQITRFCILKPARSLSPQQKIADAMGLDPQFISLAINKQESDFLDTHHEIGHLKYQVARGVISEGFEQIHIEELSADQGSLFEYWLRQEDPAERHRVTSHLVAMRALSGFLVQPPIYWFAPALEDCLQQSLAPNPLVEFTLRTKPFENYYTYSELRMRAASYIIDGHALEDFTSSELKNAIKTWDDNFSRPDNKLPIENPRLERAAEFLKVWFSPEFSELRYNGTLLRVLSQHVMRADLGDFSITCASQILRGAALLCANLNLDAETGIGADNQPGQKPS